VIETDFFQRNGADSITASGFTQIRLAFAGMNKDDGNFWSVAISLPDHLCGGAELFRGSRDGGGRT
jgi:hypothetical protein